MIFFLDREELCVCVCVCRWVDDKIKYFIIVTARSLTLHLHVACVSLFSPG